MLKDTNLTGSKPVRKDIDNSIRGGCGEIIGGSYGTDGARIGW